MSKKPAARTIRRSPSARAAGWDLAENVSSRKVRGYAGLVSKIDFRVFFSVF